MNTLVPPGESDIGRRASDANADCGVSGFSISASMWRMHPAFSYSESVLMEPERHDYKGHLIELRASEDDESHAREEGEEALLELFIDEERVRYSKLPDGSYFLPQYAYDWTEDVVDLARRFIDYQDRSDEIRRNAETG